MAVDGCSGRKMATIFFGCLRLIWENRFSMTTTSDSSPHSGAAQASEEPCLALSQTDVYRIVAHPGFTGICIHTFTTDEAFAFVNGQTAECGSDRATNHAVGTRIFGCEGFGGKEPAVHCCNFSGGHVRRQVEMAFGHASSNEAGNRNPLCGARA